MDEVGYFKTESGLVLDLELPLPDHMEHKVVRGQLVRVSPDGSPYRGEDGSVVEPVNAKRPAVNSPKNEWVGYAVGQGMSVDDADAMTKADLIEKFSK